MASEYEDEIRELLELFEDNDRDAWGKASIQRTARQATEAMNHYEQALAEHLEAAARMRFDGDDDAVAAAAKAFTVIYMMAGDDFDLAKTKAEELADSACGRRGMGAGNWR